MVLIGTNARGLRVKLNPPPSLIASSVCNARGAAADFLRLNAAAEAAMSSGT
jgi:hypothetical protein